MKRAAGRGSLEIGFRVSAFTSVPGLLGRAVVLFCRTLPFLAALTLIVLAPFKFGLHLLFEVLEIPTSGMLSYFLDGAGSYVVSALVTPAVIYGLVARLGAGPAPPLAECLRWGKRCWGRMLWNTLKMDLTVMLWSLLLLVPGLIKMATLSFTQPVVAIEGDSAGDPLERSAEISAGHRWRIFFVLAPLGILSFAATFGFLQAFRGPGFSWMAVAAMDCVLGVGEQLGTVAVLLMYLGLVRPAPTAG